MRRMLSLLVGVLTGLAILGGTVVAIAVAGSSTGTAVVCATASLPGHSVGVDGKQVATISATSTSSCVTQTYTIPTSTVMTTVTAGGNTTSSSSGGGYQGSCTQTVSPGANLATTETGMSSGQVLCLSSGTYGSTSNDFVYYAAGVTITSAPGATATIVGDQRIEAANVTEEYLNVDNSNNLDGTPSESGCPAPVSVALELDGDNDTLQYDNIYEATASLRGNLIGVGFQEEGNGVDYTHPSGVIIRHDKLSDAGQCAQQDHLIYEAEGQGAQIYDNWFWDDPHGFCIQLYPDAEDASVYGNVFDSCGAGAIVGDGGGSTVQNNVALNGVTISGDTSGTGCAFAPFGTSSGATGGNDSIVDNASWNNSNGIFCGSASTVTASGNVALSNDPFNGDATHDYTLNAYGESSVGSYGLWNGQGSPSPDPAP